MNRLAAHLHPTFAGSLRSFSTALHAYSPEDQEKIAEGLAAATHWHSFVRRKSGPLYITHLVQASTITMLVHADVQTAVAALLHDVLEDTEVTGLQLEQRFGKEIRRLVEATTKHYASSEREFLEKVYLRAQEDVRVGIIKVADRISNLSHGSRSVFTIQKQHAYLEETDRYYVEHLCMLPEMPQALTSLLIWTKDDASKRLTLSV